MAQLEPICGERASADYTTGITVDECGSQTGSRILTWNGMVSTCVAGPCDRLPSSPPSFVWFFGWVVLLLPLIIRTILWLEGVDSSMLR